MNDRVEVVCVSAEDGGGRLSPGNVVRQERCSEHVVKQTVEQNVEVGRLILKENVEVVSLALHGHISENLFGIVEVPVPQVEEQLLVQVVLLGCGARKPFSSQVCLRSALFVLTRFVRCSDLGLLLFLMLLVALLLLVIARCCACFRHGQLGHSTRGDSVVA